MADLTGIARDLFHEVRKAASEKTASYSAHLINNIVKAIVEADAAASPAVLEAGSAQQAFPVSPLISGEFEPVCAPKKVQHQPPARPHPAPAVTSSASRDFSGSSGNCVLPGFQEVN